jgi:hypothetical protein
VQVGDAERGAIGPPERAFGQQMDGGIGQGQFNVHVFL